MRGVVVGVVLLCLLAAPAGADTPFERPADAARELTAERTATTRVWELESGEHVAQVAGGPVQWQAADGRWRDFDLDLRQQGDDWIGRAGRSTVTLPDRLTGGSADGISVTNAAGDDMRMQFLGGTADAAVEGAAAEYRDVRRGVDLRLQVVPEGLKEDVVLRGPDSDRGLQYRLAVEEGAVELRADEAGGFVVWRNGRVAFHIPVPVAIDAAGTETKGRFVSRRVSDGEWEIDIELDSTWLDDANRSWPVVVDPTVNTFSTQPQDDCMYTFAGGTHAGSRCSPHSPSADRTIGGGWGRTTSGTPIYSFGALRFLPLTVFQTDVIESATLRLNRVASSTPLASNLAFYPNTTTFNRFGGAIGAVEPDWTRKATIAPGAPGSVEADVTEIVDAWRRWDVSNGAGGLANNGFLVAHDHLRFKVGGTINLTCQVAPAAVCDWTRYSSSQDPNPALRPVLEVRSWPMAPAGSEITSPREGELSGRFVKLQARAWHSSVTGVQFQYIAGNGRRWADIPLAALRTERGEALSGATVPVTDRLSRTVVWDLGATPGGEIDGPVHVRAYLESAFLQEGGATAEVDIRADRTGLARTATAPIGPGDVDLVTGEFSMTESDVTFPAFLQNLSLSRTYTSRGVARRNHDMFGPGWEGSVDSEGGDLPYKNIYNFSEIREDVETRHEIRQVDYDWETFFDQMFECLFTAEDETAEEGCLAMQPTIDYNVERIDTIKRWEYRYAVVEFGDGTKAEFKQTVNPQGEVTGWVPGEDLPGYRLDYGETSTPGTWEFVLTEPGGGVARFRSEIAGSPNHRIASYQQAGSTQNLSYTYEPSGNRQRLKRVTAPYPTGGTPRWLELTWANVGGTNVRVTAVRVGSGNATGTTVAQYAYSARGLLLRSWDPRVSPSLVTEYVYDNRGLLAQVRPPGEEEWRLAYDRTSADVGYRLVSVSRDHPDGGTATRSVRYGVPVSGAGAPYDLSFAQTARWNQQVENLPWQAVAIFPEDDVPGGSTVDYSRATIHYLDDRGRQVNLARPGGHISYTGYDANGNVTRQLTASNRQQALAAGASSTAVAHDLTALNTYSPDGIELVGTFEPRTEIELSDGSVVSGRRFTATHYDQGSPNGRAFHLPTSRLRGVELDNGNEVDVRTVATIGYSGLGGMDGWTARHATQTVIDPGGARLTSYSFLHPQYPIVEETRRPRGAAGGARPDVRFYQYAGITPSNRVPAALRTGTVCEPGTPSGFLCMDSESTVPDAGVPRRWYAYNADGLQTTRWESRSLTKTGAPARVTAVGYDAAGREISRSITGGVGEPVPTTTYAYSPTTGRQTSVSAPGRGTISRLYDSNGRLQQYTDASGLVTRYTYDLRGRVTQTVEDGSRTARYGYDDRDNRISVTDPDIATPITASYDADGKQASETLPNGLRALFGYDELGRRSSVEWVMTTNCASDCVRLRSTLDSRDVDGRITKRSTLSIDEAYEYDSIGRLSRVSSKDILTDTCVREQYYYDASYNRTRSDRTTSAVGAACGSGVASSRTWGHDAADRVTNVGWMHDAFGRATAVPAPDSGGRGPLAAGYYADDLVRQLSLDGRTHTYDRDPAGRTSLVTSTGSTPLATRTTNRFADDSDTPVATTRSDGSTGRAIAGTSGNLVALQEGTRLTYQLYDVQGNIGATVPAADAAARPSARTSYDIFGTVVSSAPHVIDWTSGTPGYGWLGGHQRSTEFEQFDGAGGPMEMGVRVYVPAVGRFLQVDPVDGGSANPYEYALQDPVNQYDLDGRCVFGAPCPDIIKKAKRKLKRAVSFTAQSIWSGAKSINAASRHLAKLAGKIAEGVRGSIPAINRPSQMDWAWRCGSHLGGKKDTGACDPLELLLGTVEPAY